MSRKQLIEKAARLENELREIRKQIDAIDYEKRLSEAMKYQGGYFKSIDRNPRYVFVYDVCKINCEPISISFYYYKDDERTCVHLDTQDTFFPCDSVEWVKISKNEFIKHYSIVENELIKITKP